MVSIIKQIKNLKDKEIVFELEKGSRLLSSSANLKLIKRTGETLKKKISVTTNDPIGRLLAIKAGVLEDQTEDDMKRLAPRKSQQPSEKRAFDDMRARIPRVLPLKTISELKSKSHKIFGKKTLRVTGAAVAGVLILAIAAAILLPQANIIVYARSEPIARDIDVTVDQNVTVPDAASLSIPGKLFDKEVSETQSFKATGTNLTGTKATGKVLIYNGTSNTLTLRAATTTLVFDGKKYFFTKDATGIKPTTAQSNTNTPVEIIAEQAGEGYNLDSLSKFEIKNTALGNRPEVYAVASGAIAGGAAMAKLVVSQDDLDFALNKITEDLIANAEKELALAVPGTKLLPSGVTKEILAHTANKNPGDEADNFDLTVIAKIKGLTFNEQDVADLLDQQIKSVLADDKYIVEGAKKTIRPEFKDKDLNLGKGTLAVHYDSIIAYKVDVNSLERILAGKKPSEIKEILLSKPEIEQVEIELWPFFVRQAPKLNGKIYIKTVLSQM